MPTPHSHSESTARPESAPPTRDAAEIVDPRADASTPPGSGSERRGAPRQEIFHKRRPLGDLVSGILTIHFAGKSVRRRMSLSQARTFNQMTDGGRSADGIAWHDLGWLQFDNRNVLASEFDVDEDLGWT